MLFKFYSIVIFMVDEKYLKAGKIAAEVREESKKLIEPGARLLDIAEAIEKLINNKGADMAFPVNLSINEIAAHYTPLKNDTVFLKETDIIKVDIGVHIDGYIGDTAYSISLDKSKEDLVKASELALENAIKLCKPETKVSEIGHVIRDTIESRGFNPITNLTGHGLERFDLHAKPSIPNIPVGTEILKQDQVIAIEPFATDGKGFVKDSGSIMIYTLVAPAPVRSETAREVIKLVADRQRLPFTERWFNFTPIKLRLGLHELRQRGVLYDYPMLREESGKFVSQAEHTVIVGEEPIVTTEFVKKIDEEQNEKHK